jgi:hypothetical protein
MNKQLFLLPFVFLSCTLTLTAQEDSETSDFAATDSSQSYDMYAQNDSDSTTEIKVAVKKPYVRVQLPLDTNSGLITYEEVVEQEITSADSIYVRVQKWVRLHFGKSASIYVTEVKGSKLVFNGYMNAYIKPNRFVTNSVGKILFQMTVLVKEGRYKIIVKNLVHEPNPTSLRKDRYYVYLEFYQTAETGFKMTDQYLRCADEAVKKMIVSLKAAVKERVVIDEDDW